MRILGVFFVQGFDVAPDNCKLLLGEDGSGSELPKDVTLQSLKEEGQIKAGTKLHLPVRDCVYVS